jgi:hypothetical protein
MSLSDNYFLSSSCRAPSLTRGRVCNFQRNHSLVSHAGPITIYYCLIWDSPNLEGQVPIFISPRNRVAQLYLQALGSLFVAPYDSQGYGGGILTRLILYHGLQPTPLIRAAICSSSPPLLIFHSYSVAPPIVTDETTTTTKFLTGRSGAIPVSRVAISFVPSSLSQRSLKSVFYITG